VGTRSGASALVIKFILTRTRAQMFYDRDKTRYIYFIFLLNHVLSANNSHRK